MPPCLLSEGMYTIQKMLTRAGQKVVDTTLQTEDVERLCHICKEPLVYLHCFIVEDFAPCSRSKECRAIS